MRLQFLGCGDAFGSGDRFSKPFSYIAWRNITVRRIQSISGEDKRVHWEGSSNRIAH